MDQYFVHQGAVIESLEESHGLLLLTAEVCNQKAEIDEGVETLFTDFFNDLECFCCHQYPCFQWVTIKMTSVTARATSGGIALVSANADVARMDSGMTQNPHCARRRRRQDQSHSRSGACIIGVSTSNVAMNAAGDRSNSNVGVLILLPPSYTQATW
jgi:hypothetical protein